MFFGLSQAQNIPSIGDSLSIEIANWNIEWFGKTTPGFGPSNDSLQQVLVTKTISSSKVDVWVLCEVSDTTAFKQLLAKVPEYSGYLASYFPEQKTAVLYQNKTFSGLYKTLKGTNNKDSFSTSRYPLEVALIPINKNFIDTLFLLAIHLKSNTGNDSQKLAAYYSRMRSAEWINLYINSTKFRKNMMICGDWNDDLDVSIYNNLPTPFNILKKVGQPLNFITESFTNQHIGTTTSYSDAIDHQYVSANLKQHLQLNSPFIWRLDNYINNYSNTCSDHYPVVSKFISLPSSINGQTSRYCSVFPNPSNTILQIEGVDSIQTVNIIDLNGQSILQEVGHDKSLDVSQLEAGIYILKIVSEEKLYIQKIQIVR